MLPFSSDIYIIGGEMNPSEPLNSVEKYTGSGFLMANKTNLACSRHCALAYSDTEIVIIGGIVAEELFSRRTFTWNIKGKIFTKSSKPI